MRSFGAACVLVLVGCSPFGETGPYMCGSDGDCNNGELGVCSGTVSEPGTCSYGGKSPISSDGGTLDVGMIDPPQSDAPRGSGSAQTCWGTTLMLCPTTIPTSSHSKGPELIDTDHDCDFTWPQTNGPTLCVISATDWTLGAIQVVGNAPLVVFATDTITVVGYIDASSVPGSPGPDADDPTSSDPTDTAPCASLTASLAGDGGTGGSFGQPGGAGAGGGTGGSAGGSPSTKAITPTTIRGGCVGQASRTTSGGDGGGAIYLLAGREIDINSELLANGEGGGGGKAGGQSSGGGAGGGAGGFIGLEAPTININADPLLLQNGIVLALGGGGGGGGGDFSGPPGPGPGLAGQPNVDGGAGANGDAYVQKNTLGTIPGGTPGSSKAGAGGSATTAAGNGGGGATDGTAGGGGGGGGAGVIWTTGTVHGNTLILPAPIAK